MTLRSLKRLVKFNKEAELSLQFDVDFNVVMDAAGAAAVHKAFVTGTGSHSNPIHNQLAAAEPWIAERHAYGDWTLDLQKEHTCLDGGCLNINGFRY